MDEGVDELAGVQHIAKAPPVKPLSTDSKTREKEEPRNIMGLVWEGE